MGGAAYVPILADDITDARIVMNADAPVDLPEGLGVGVSDAKIEQYRVADPA